MVTVSYFLIGLHAKIDTFLTTLLTCVLIEWSTASVGVMISSVSDYSYFMQIFFRH